MRQVLPGGDDASQVCWWWQWMALALRWMCGSGAEVKNTISTSEERAMSLINRVLNQVRNVEVKLSNMQKNSAEVIYQGIKEQTVDLLEARAQAWISENKLIHAGAARKLAKELMEKK
jgi:predicted RNA-binding protein with PUA domain